MNSPDQFLKNSVSQKKKGTGKVMFLANMPKIKEYIESGHSKKSVWEALSHSGMFSLTYSQFLKYINRYLNPSPDDVKPSSMRKNSQKSENRSELKTTPPSDDPYLKKVAKWNPRAMPLDELV